MKNKIISIMICMLFITTTCLIGESLKISNIQNASNQSMSLILADEQNALIFGKIANFSTYDGSLIFQAVKIKIITFSPFSFNPYNSGECFQILKEHKGFIGINFIFAFTTLYTPKIACVADSFINRIFIVATDADIKWRDIEISLDKPGASYRVYHNTDTPIAPINNTVNAGDAEVTVKEYIELSTYKGNVSTTLRFIPTNIVFGTWTIDV